MLLMSGQLFRAGPWKIDILCSRGTKLEAQKTYDVSVYDTRDVIIVRDEELDTVAKGTEFKFEGWTRLKDIDKNISFTINCRVWFQCCATTVV